MADFKGITESFIIKQKQEFQKQLFWPNLKNGPFNKFEDPVCCIKYCQTLPNFAMACGFQVEIRDPSANNALLKSFHRFKSPVRSLAYRGGGGGGGLISIGESNGHLSTYSVAMRTELRKMVGHTAAVTGLAFMAAGSAAAAVASSPKLASCSEDGRCLLWDVADPQGQPLMEFRLPPGATSGGATAEDAADKATALDASLTDCNLLACGLSDGRAALFDARQPRPVLVVNHGHPITSVRLAPGDNALYLAGDCWVRAVSLHQGGRQIAAYKRHHKHVTDLAVGRGALLSCGLDGLVKVTDLLTYEEVHKYEYPNCGLLCLGLAPSDANCMALGTNDKWLLTRRFESADAAATAAETAAASNDPYLKAVRADRVMPARPEDSVSAADDRRQRQLSQPPRLQPLDKLFKSFRHSDALSHVIVRGELKRRPHRAAAALRELARRGGLATALAGRSDEQVAALMKFVLHSLGNQELAADTLPLAWDLVDLYACELASRPCLKGLFERLRALLAREIGLGQQFMTSLGRIDLLLDAASVAQAGSAL